MTKKTGRRFNRTTIKFVSLIIECNFSDIQTLVASDNIYNNNGIYFEGLHNE